MDYLFELRKEKMSELQMEPMLAPREVLWHDKGLVVLETPGEAGEASRTRSLHFESCIGVVQTEVKHGEKGLDHGTLLFGVHKAFLRILEDRAKAWKGEAATVVVLGGGGGVVPMAIAKRQEMAEHSSSFHCIRASDFIFF